MVKSKTCLIYGPRHSSHECKVLGYFGSEYDKPRPTKYLGNNTIPENKFNRQQGNNVIINIAVDEILLHENENIESDFDDKELYHIDNMSLEDTKENI